MTFETFEIEASELLDVWQLGFNDGPDGLARTEMQLDIFDTAVYCNGVAEWTGEVDFEFEGVPDFLSAFLAHPKDDRRKMLRWILSEAKTIPGLMVRGEIINFPKQVLVTVTKPAPQRPTCVVAFSKSA